MKEIVRTCLNSYKDQRRKEQFQKQLGSKYKKLVSDCESIVVENFGVKVYSKFHDMGGVNNHGMLMHYSVKDSHAVAITKIEDQPLAEREYRFLVWQDKYCACTLSANPIGLIPVSGTKYSCFISTVLDHPKKFSYVKAEHLFHELGQHPKMLSKLALSETGAGLKEELDDSTKIKSILVHLVSQFGSEASRKFFKQFLQEREKLFVKKSAEFISLKVLMDDVFGKLNECDLRVYEGLVHGDFKPQNILEDKNTYKVIDCQYYTYGIRLWDLAFLYSKKVDGFQSIKLYVERLSSFEEKALILFFYIIACLINAKKKRASKIMTSQLLPTVQEIRKLLANPESKSE